MARDPSSIQSLLQYRIVQIQPACIGTWPAFSRCLLGHKFRAKKWLLVLEQDNSSMALPCKETRTSSATKL
jgi:hypothetical protein